MSFVVPFDGSELAESALVRAVEYGNSLNEEVVAVSIVPERKRYAREKGWIGRDEEYDIDSTVEQLRERVNALAPDATFEYERIREFPPAEGIADHIERIAQEHDPSVLFLGSNNVGRVVTPLTSVSAIIGSEDLYDVHIVRRPGPSRIEGLEPHPEFYDEKDADR